MNKLFLLLAISFFSYLNANDPQHAIKLYKQANYKKALQYIKPLAKQGDSSIQHLLGYMYAKGEGMPVDTKKAIEWYKKAAKQGNTSSQINIGYMYAHGIGVSKNEKKAVEWYKKAAKLDDGLAQHNLAKAYCLGQGVPKDLKQCAYWAKKSMNNGLDLYSLWKQFELDKYNK